MKIPRRPYSPREVMRGFPVKVAEEARDTVYNLEAIRRRKKAEGITLDHNIWGALEQAVWVEDSPDSPEMKRVSVSIVDGSVIANPDSLSAQEALYRYKSRYYDGGAFAPMLHPLLYNSKMSLNSFWRERVIPTLTVSGDVHQDGSYSLVGVERTYLENASNFSCKGFRNALQDEDDRRNELCNELYEVAQRLFNDRVYNHYSIDFDALNDGIDPADMVVKEFSIFANHLMACFCRENDVGVIYTVSESQIPWSQRKEIRKMFRETGMSKLDKLKAKNKILGAVNRSEYSTDPASGHEVLDFGEYMNATRPVRDVVSLINNMVVSVFTSQGQSMFPAEGMESLAEYFNLAETQVRREGKNPQEIGKFTNRKKAFFPRGINPSVFLDNMRSEKVSGDELYYVWRYYGLDRSRSSLNSESFYSLLDESYVLTERLVKSICKLDPSWESLKLEKIMMRKEGRRRRNREYEERQVDEPRVPAYNCLLQRNGQLLETGFIRGDDAYSAKHSALLSLVERVNESAQEDGLQMVHPREERFADTVDTIWENEVDSS